VAVDFAVVVVGLVVLATGLDAVVVLGTVAIVVVVLSSEVAAWVAAAAWVVIVAAVSTMLSSVALFGGAALQPAKMNTRVAHTDSNTARVFFIKSYPFFPLYF